MLKIAHRGYSAGEDENTLSKINYTITNNLADGIEIDLWLHNNEIVLSHDKPKNNKKYDKFIDVLNIIKDKELYLMLEIKDTNICLLENLLNIFKGQNILKDKIVIFAFENVAKHIFTEKMLHKIKSNGIKVGVIAEYPNDIDYVYKKYKPNIIALGWDYIKINKILFKIYWSIFSLRKIKKKYDIQLFTGIAFNKKDIKFLQKIGSDFISIDFPI